MATPVKAIPEDYHEARHLLLTSPENLLLLNVLSFVLIVPFLALMILWTAAVRDWRGVASGGTGLPDILLWLAVILVLPLHEWIHGLAIQWVGHQPRYGAKYAEVGPIKIPFILYATADQALFRRYEFVVVALAPVIVITLLGMLLVYLLPDAFSRYLAVAVLINGTGAICG